MELTLEPTLETLVDACLRHRPPQGMAIVGVAGIPGSGKSTLAARLAEALPDAAVLPMDGYHLRRDQLDEEGKRRRGAPWTFDAARFRQDLLQLRAAGEGVFPSFDHAVKDPVEGAIQVTSCTQWVIVEGLYLLLRDWNLWEVFDLTLFLDCDVDTAMRRVAERHEACGLAADLAQALARVEQNDRVNANLILHDGCPTRATLRVRTDG